MIFAPSRLSGGLLMGLVLLDCAGLPGPWPSNEAATEVFPRWLVRLLAFLASLWFFYPSGVGAAAAAGAGVFHKVSGPTQVRNR